METQTILFLTATPPGTDPLGTDVEAREIEEQHARSSHRSLFRVVTRWAVRRRELLGALRDVKPAIVHFAGHAGADGIYLLDDHGQRAAVPPEAVRAAFKAAGRSVKIVVLNACATQAVANLLCEVVPVCVGTSSAVLDGAAIDFATGFYGGIMAGYSARDSFEQGKASIHIAHGADLCVHDHHRDVDPGELRLAPAPGPGSPENYALIGGGAGRPHRGEGDEPAVSTDAVLVESWLRHGDLLHAQIPVLSLRWRDAPGPVRPVARRQPVDEVFVPLFMQSASDHGHRGASDHNALREEVTLERALEFAGRRGPVRVVLLGDPGAGKTTILRHLFGRLAHGLSQRAEVPAPLIGLHPVWVSLSALTDVELAAADLAPAVRRVARAEHHEAAAEILLRSGSPSLLLLLDGLDEIRDRGIQERTCALVARTADRWIASAIIVTSRRTQWASLRAGDPRGTDEWGALAARFDQVSVEGMGPDTRAAYVYRWFRTAARQRAMRADDGVDAAARADADRFLAVLREPARALETRHAQMIANPLMLSALCALHATGGTLPDRVTELYDVVLQLLIENWQRPDRPALPAGETRQVLEPLAYKNQEGAGRALPLAAANRVVAPLLKKAGRLLTLTPTAAHFLTAMRNDCGILAGDDPDHVEFLHLQFREHLAAGHVQRRRLGRALAKRLLSADQAHWQETMVLAMQLDGVSGPFVAAALAGGALAAPGSSEREAARRAALLRRCVVAAGDRLDPDPIVAAIDRALVRLRGGGGDGVRAELTALFELVRGLELPVLVGRWHDFQAAIGQTVVQARWDWTPGAPQVLPVTGMAFRWIPHGRFTMGSSDDDPEADGDERPAHTVDITCGYWMGEHPVTNEQYRAFVAATGNATPKHWGDPRFNDPAQPVVGVSWHDARAFCAWINQQVPSWARLGFRLPTEAEWEYAARGADGRRYPWGTTPEPDASRAVFGLDWETGRPSAVGQHPAGISRFGLHDMAGNVWEWCADEKRSYTREQIADPGRDVDRTPDRQRLRDATLQGASRVIRGGSWLAHAGLARAAYRLAYSPGFASLNLGFRVAGGQESALK